MKKIIFSLLPVLLVACNEAAQTPASSSDSGAVGGGGGIYKLEAGYVAKPDVQKLYDELDYQRGVQAYIWGVPLVNAVAMGKALTDAGVSESEPSLLVFNKQLTPKQVIMTANSEVIYAFSIVDLSKTGPLVIESPGGILGGVIDLWQRAVKDIGIGESAHGGKILLLPPDYKGKIPSGYIIAKSGTKRNIIFGRGIVLPGQDTGPFVKLASSIKLYPLTEKDNPRPTKIILNDGKPFNSDWPKDIRYFGYLSEGLKDAVIEPQDKLMYAMMQPLGIFPGKTFNPDERIKNILARSAQTGSDMMINMAFDNRLKDTKPLWKDRMWENIAFTTTPVSENDTIVELDQRTQWYQLVCNAAYGYGAKLVPGTGTWYASTFRDNAGTHLQGSNMYKLVLTTAPPAKQFWSVTVYDNRTRSMIDTDQQKAGLSSLGDLKKNADGSIELYFGPEAPQGMESNWIKTIPEQGWFVMFRLYAPLEPLFDGSWKLPDLETMK